MPRSKKDAKKFDIKVCLIKNGYPPQYSPEVFRKVMEQELLCRGWFLPPNTYDCGSFVVN